MRTVVLSGFMATGKSTVGPMLAARLGVPFVDTDAEIERETGKRIPELFREEGEARFRVREADLVEKLLSRPEPQVVAFGGGTVTTARARRFAVDHALLVTLTAAPDTIISRVPDVEGRPNLLGGEPMVRARELLDQRREAYAEAHLTLSSDTLEPTAIVDAIAALQVRDPILVPLGARSYCIDVCTNEPSRLTDALARCGLSSLILVTDSNVKRARGHAIEAALSPFPFEGTRIVLPPGEAFKTLTTMSTIWDAALGAGLDRDAILVAAGGGVVGDMGGFAAATLLRGIRFVQVPTTLLAMVDASVVGKTGFDHPVGKNLIGAFQQPSAVVADLAHLTTLPVRERAAGLAEVVKIALTSDEGLLELLERDAAALARGEQEALLPVVRRAIAAKVRVVRDDERESGARALLNLGHTVGHALEAHGGYAKWLHGEAVALGLVVELAATASLGWTPPELARRTKELLIRLGLPGDVSRSEVAASWHYVGADKKRTGASVRLPVTLGPGRARVEKVLLKDLEKAALSG
jgi:shikimate kinase/3-dehydroquinate synthase